MKKSFVVLFTLFVCVAEVFSETRDSALWLRKVEGVGASVSLMSRASAVTDVAMSEVRTLCAGNLHVTLERRKMSGMRKDAFKISVKDNEVVINSPSDQGLLYGVYHIARLESMGALDGCRDTVVIEVPQHDLRILNHWDNMDGTVERGYAGKSIFPLGGGVSDKTLSHLRQYCRANASLGINGVVLNNVNASPDVLRSDVLMKVRDFADVMRLYGIRVYLSVNFSSPMILGGTTDADPMSVSVRKWWRDKSREIYRLIPDFGGFLVKANSEGQPGPMDYGRTHADGANMLADCLRPYGGVVMWRAFVYSPNDADRAKQAYNEFAGLDGVFADNVVVQVKNGPIDFQPREPYNPLFGAMRRTQVMAELQVTQEYLGHSNHICYLGTMWSEFFDEVRRYASYSDMMSRQRIKAIAGVANVGDSPDFCGNTFAQANWYAFGRLAWNSEMDVRGVATEWCEQTFGRDNASIGTIVDMMMMSRETVVSYMMPLGLHHIFAEGHHYGPQPWQNNPGQRADWQCVYYHRADTAGVGFNRTDKGGSDATSQYPEAFAGLVKNMDECPDKYLLWFHHVPWTHKCRSGRTLWDEMCYKYQDGLNGAREMLRKWCSVKTDVPETVYGEIRDKLQIQVRDAEWWKDACVSYFQTFSGMPLPDCVEPPVHSLEEMMNVRLGISNYECPSREKLNSIR